MGEDELRERIEQLEAENAALRARLDRVRSVRDREIARYEAHRRMCPIPLTEAEQAWQGGA